MKLCNLLALSVLSLACAVAGAQAPASVTGQCNDGSYTNASTRDGACQTHKGVKQWFGQGKTSPSATVKGRPVEAPQPKAIPARDMPPLNKTDAQPTPGGHLPPHPSANQAPGGGPGIVWVNSASKVYHCQGDRYYGRTKQGKYMSEAEAQKMGADGPGGKPCKR